MGKIHVLMRKEEIDTHKIQGKVAVVFDIMLATSTIIAGLHHGAEEVIPVLDGFLDPNPLALKEHVKEKTIILICAGSGGEFCIEDFYGAGYVLDCLFSGGAAEWEMTDAAQAARQFYCGAQDQAEHILISSRVGRMMQQYQLEEDVYFVATKGLLKTLPILDKEKLTMKEGDKCYV